ncbi:uncharacterized protein LOC134231560 [Saccostrea cucullata]|uniref:uncharacterized protein LOC134231560 n=1 Tax=Saccostrea cuccullata TaxID=36930 RepID=UPI002ED3DE80
MKKTKLHIYAIWGLIFFASKTMCESDPCLTSNHHNLHHAGWRGSSCGYQAPGVCDKRIDSRWYSVKGNDDKSYRKMVEGPVDMFYCGAINPISLKHQGTHPTISDGIVNRTACLSGSESFCEKNITIQIKNCGGFYVYKLKNTSSCSSAYCFGIGLECPKPDPCNPENRVTLTVGEDRSKTCKSSSLKLCDSFLKSSWYRIQYKGRDVKMPNACVDQHSCGTTFPIWLHGREPSIEDKVADLKACVSTGKGHNCTCSKEYNIQVKNCTTYLVYNLSSTQGCPERYCFGSSGECKVKKDSQSSSTDFWKYVYGSVAAVCLTMVLGGIMYFLYRKIQSSHLKVADETKDSRLGKQIKPVHENKGKM